MFEELAFLIRTSPRLRSTPLSFYTDSGRRKWRSGVPRRLLSFREGTRSERCHFISVWGELADHAYFSIAKLEREVHDGKGM